MAVEDTRTSIARLARISLSVGFALIYFFRPIAHAAAADKSIPTMYVLADVSFFVAKSDAIGGTDFGTSYSVEAGTWTGKGKNIGLGIREDSLSLSFSQIDGSLRTLWRDFSISYRYLWFNPAIIFGSCEMEFVSLGVTIADSLCTTIGGALRFRIPLGPSIIGLMNFDLVTPDNVKDVAGITNTLGTRLTWETGVSLNPKVDWIYVHAGYRYRSFALEAAGKTTSEMQTGPFLSAQLALNF